MELITGMWPFKQRDGPVSWNFCSSTLLSFCKLIAISSWVNGSCGHNEIGIDHLKARSHKLVVWGISAAKHSLDPISSYLSPWPHIFFEAFWTQHTCSFLRPHAALQGTSKEHKGGLYSVQAGSSELQRTESSDLTASALPLAATSSAGPILLSFRCYPSFYHSSDQNNALTALSLSFPNWKVNTLPISLAHS